MRTHLDFCQCHQPFNREKLVPVCVSRQWVISWRITGQFLMWKSPSETVCRQGWGVSILTGSLSLERRVDAHIQRYERHKWKGTSIASGWQLRCQQSLTANISSLLISTYSDLGKLMQEIPVKTFAWQLRHSEYYLFWFSLIYESACKLSEQQSSHPAQVNRKSQQPLAPVHCSTQAGPARLWGQKAPFNLLE